MKRSVNSEFHNANDIHNPKCDSLPVKFQSFILSRYNGNTKNDVGASELDDLVEDLKSKYSPSDGDVEVNFTK